ncbi:MAG TPA: type IV pili twitching motility protein PilT, partial [Thiomicrorhabdus sp.]|nr:type IV pili twitching motility protein PilT [Thiomicrorhabdus sp.]
TIEDPIEFVHSHKRSIVTQREVGVDTDTYDTALKNTLRQAPNVILIGEIRAKETMEHAIAFAETGHLCLSTLHSNNTNQTLDRIINFFPPDQHAHILMDLSLNLRAIVSQRLIPKIGGGLIAAVEVLINTPRISELILKGKVSEIKQLMQNSQALGMQTFDQSLFKLHEDGIVTYEDALRAADSANDLRLNIKLNSKRPIPSDTANGEIAEETQFQLKTDPNESGN